VVYGCLGLAILILNSESAWWIFFLSCRCQVPNQMDSSGSCFWEEVFSQVRRVVYGSLVIWDGYIWQGSLSRFVSSMRISILIIFILSPWIGHHLILHWSGLSLFEFHRTFSYVEFYSLQWHTSHYVTDLSAKINLDKNVRTSNTKNHPNGDSVTGDRCPFEGFTQDKLHNPF